MGLIGKVLGDPSIPETKVWREKAGNALINSGYQNFKDLFNNPYQNPMDWDIKQLKNEQQTLQPIHEKYLGGHDNFNDFSSWWTNQFDHKGIPKVNVIDYNSRVEYGCSLMGYGKNQGCKP